MGPDALATRRRRLEPGDGDLHTETFTNARGWTAVRVTHLPTSTVAERSRSDALRSAVQAQRECMEEIRRALTRDPGDPTRDPGDEAAAPKDAVAGNGGPERVTRAEFDALLARVARLEQEIGGDGYGTT